MQAYSGDARRESVAPLLWFHRLAADWPRRDTLTRPGFGVSVI
jgi:hypothetical protein